MIQIEQTVKKVLLDILMKYLRAKEDDLITKLKETLNHSIELDFYQIVPKEECWLTVEIMMIMAVEEEFIDYKVGRISVDENGLSVFGYTEQLTKILKEIYA